MQDGAMSEAEAIIKLAGLREALAALLDFFEWVRDNWPQELTAEWQDRISFELGKRCGEISKQRDELRKILTA